MRKLVLSLVSTRNTNPFKGGQYVKEIDGCTSQEAKEVVERLQTLRVTYVCG